MNKTITLAVFTCLLSLTNLVLAEEGRWYSGDQANRGVQLFLENCASCHGASAEASANWKEKDSEGKFPPPPLNGSGHAWHHSPQQLRKTIQQGSIQIGGVMPEFSSKLNDDDIDSVIAFFQSKWPDATYQKWASQFKVSALDPKMEEITRFLKLRLGTANITPPVETPIKGVYQTQFGDRYGYLIGDGRYVFIGDLIDLERQQNLTEISRRQAVNIEINQVAASNLAIFPAKNIEKAVLNVFTDTSCPYCKRLHEEVSYLQDAGITVRYFPYPRGSSRGPGYSALKQVWCAKDKADAMSIAKGTATGELPAGDCDAASFVDEGYAMGNRIGITGTPALFLQNGTKIDGYRPYRELIPMVLESSL
jgi:thiol:disulfide interchange protein DsbC